MANPVLSDFPLNLWAFYRIKKLQRYIALVWAPSILISASLYVTGYYEMTLIDTHEEQMDSDASFATLHDSNQATSGKI